MICPTAFRRFDARLALVAGLGLALPLAFALAAEKPAPESKSDKLQAIQQHNRELEANKEQQRKSAETEAELKHEIEQIGADRRKLNKQLIETAGRLRDLERKVTESETRLQALDDDERDLHKSLDGRRAVIGEVLAALQRVGRNPPPALIASPEDALQSVRTAMLLGAVVPEMRQQVEELANNLSELVAVRKKIAAERDQLKNQVASLHGQRTRMTALVAARQKQQAAHEKALDAERARATQLAHQADNLKDLIAKLEQSVVRAEREVPRTDAKTALAALHDPGRMAPAVTFASLRGRIPIPVNGVKIKKYGAPDGVGGLEKGVSLATRAGAQVTAPTDGWVVYAGPFRSYGQLLILNAGGGYHVLLAGMERISVDLGQFVLTGEPVAVMGNGSHVAAILATGSSQPVLYVEFRKNGVPVDPGPWWASGEGAKARG